VTTRVLVVDDDPHILRAIRIHLTTSGYAVSTAQTGRAALRAGAAEPLDLVLLDLGLPDLDGTVVIGELRRWSSVPIIVLSARSDGVDKITALDTGADDYVTKPFSFPELLARMRAAVRRSVHGSPANVDTVVDTQDFSIDLVAKRVITCATGQVHLTPTEWAILELLVRNRGALVSQRRLLNEIWGPAYRTETNYLRVYLAQLRRKLEPEPARPRYLITEPGMGYRFQD
jgi:two-component system, OmpR family, KDP operon response regulator KdpE